MAKKNTLQRGTAKHQGKAGGKKPIGVRFKNFFGGIRAELKRVSWPDKKRLKQSTVTVLAIILMFVVLVWVFDTVIRSVFTASGFYSAKPVETKPASEASTDVGQIASQSAVFVKAPAMAEPQI